VFSCFRFDFAPPPFSKEGPQSWVRVTEDTKKPKAAPKPKARTLLLAPDPMPVLEPPAKKPRAEPSTSTAPVPPPAREPPPRPLPPPARESTALVLKRPVTTIEVEFEGLRKQAERREQTFLLEPDVKERRVPIPVPAGVSARITVEFVLNA
jgi:hypothetical protein